MKTLSRILLLLTFIVLPLCLWAAYLCIVNGWYVMAFVNAILAIVNGYLGYVNYLNYRYTNWWEQGEKPWHKLENQ